MQVLGSGEIDRGLGSRVQGGIVGIVSSIPTPPRLIPHQSPKPTVPSSLFDHVVLSAWDATYTFDESHPNRSIRVCFFPPATLLSSSKLRDADAHTSEYQHGPRPHRNCTRSPFPVVCFPVITPLPDPLSDGSDHHPTHKVTFLASSNESKITRLRFFL